jgi:hypothetical protein
LRGAAGEFVIVTVSVITTATDIQILTDTFASVQQMILQQSYSSTPVDLPFLLHTKLIPICSSGWPAWPLVFEEGIAMQCCVDRCSAATMSWKLKKRAN